MKGQLSVIIPTSLNERLISAHCTFLDALMKTLNYGGQLNIRDVARAVFYQCCPRTRANKVF